LRNISFVKVETIIRHYLGATRELADSGIDKLHRRDQDPARHEQSSAHERTQHGRATPCDINARAVSHGIRPAWVECLIGLVADAVDIEPVSARKIPVLCGKPGNSLIFHLVATVLPCD
jgi:hypothetical protein